MTNDDRTLRVFGKPRVAEFLRDLDLPVQLTPALAELFQMPSAEERLAPVIDLDSRRTA